MHADTQTIFDKALKTDVSLAPGALNTRYETLNGHLNLKRKHWDMGFWAFNSINAGTRAGAAGALDPNGSADGEQYLGDVRFSTEDWLDNWEFIAHATYLQADFQADNLHLFPAGAVLPIGSDGNINTATNDKFEFINSRVLFPEGVIADLGRIERIPSFELSSVYKGLHNHILRFSSGFRYEEVSPSESKNYGPGVIDATKVKFLPPPEINVAGGPLTNVTGTDNVYLESLHRTIWSLVAQDEWQIADGWQLTAGVRYDDYSDFGGTVNPRVALVWDINDQFTSKLLYGKAFRAPNFGEQGFQNNPVVQGNKDLDPETIHTVELALDYRPFSSLRTAVNIFYYKINNLITAAAPDPRITALAVNTDSNKLNPNIYRNSGNQDGYGSELEWNWQMSEQWNVKGNYAWQHSTNEQNDQPVAGVPEHHVYVAFQWQFLPEWQFQPQLNWIGGRTSLPDDNRKLGDYETIDFTLRGKKLFGHLNLAASLRNAFDTKYYAPAAIQLPENLPMPGRSFYLEASINF